MFRRVVFQKLTHVLEVLIAYAIKAVTMMEVAVMSWASVKFDQTTQWNNTEDSYLRIKHAFFVSAPKSQYLHSIPAGVIQILALTADNFLLSLS